MGVRRVFKKFLKYLIPTLLVLLIIPVTGRKYQSRKSLDSFREKPLRAALALGDFDILPRGYLTGFNYELLKTFAGTHCDSVRIFLGEKNVPYLDSLRLDSLDILVVPSREVTESQDITILHPIDTSVAWVIRKDPYRGHEILKWASFIKASPDYQLMTRRFFQGYNPYRTGKKDPSIISPYDHIIKKNAKLVGWDWRLLASMIWNESMFHIQARSPRGAMGLMQMMPRTAKSFGLSDMLDPEENIAAGTRYIQMLQKTFSAFSTDPEVVRRLTIAAYNCGEGRALEDLDGREQSSETAAYTKAVLNLYDFFRGVEPKQDTLLGPDSLGGIDPGDEHARDEEEQHDDQE
ncbi:MAG: transglycosylase SLT domain-containing protein [Bacteroidales bacterium]|nr:transglycosylase SLT domain-containing protein [Bacteroidales bacterium]